MVSSWARGLTSTQRGEGRCSPNEQLLLGALLILFGLPGPSRGDDLSDSKEVFDLGVKAVNARRLSLLATTFDRRLSVYAPHTPTLVGRDQYLEHLRNVFGLYDEFTVHPAETDFQVTGDTAVVTSKYVVTIRPSQASAVKHRVGSSLDNL